MTTTITTIVVEVVTVMAAGAVALVVAFDLELIMCFKKMIYTTFDLLPLTQKMTSRFEYETYCFSMTVTKFRVIVVILYIKIMGACACKNDDDNTPRTRSNHTYID
jgi:hypothetical protein